MENLEFKNIWSARFTGTIGAAVLLWLRDAFYNL